MKRALRIIVPLLLALAVLAGTAWYFLDYDQGLTKELLLQYARTSEEKGNYKLSAFLYDLAYRQSHLEDNVAIELARQFVTLGNYTKAEYTLSKAIAANPTAELYTALSQLYVEQDKLMDAVNMLDGVYDPTIKALLDYARPETPALTPAPGFYSKYITVEASGVRGTLYLSSDGEYPSVVKDAYQGPMTLSSGETVLYALCVGDNGLVSRLAIHGYTIGGVIEKVEFTDPAVDAAIRAAVEAEEDDVIYTDRLWGITDFVVPKEAQSYEDLAYLPYLKNLIITKDSTGDLSVLDALIHLESLTIDRIRLQEADLQTIAKRTGLKRLSLQGCSLSGIQPLEALTHLEYLDLSNNTLRNISPLSAMTELKELYLNNNALVSLDALKPMKSLEVLDVSFNALTQLDPVFALSRLTTLNANNNHITSVLGIASLTELVNLNLSDNSLSDVKMLAVLTKLEELRLSNNAITDITGMEALANVRILTLANNQITQLPPFVPSCHLVSIDISGNQLADLEPLTGLGWLNTVNADYNPDLESLEPLDTCPVLIRVNAYGTKVTEVGFLTAKSIIVNYDPTLEED